MSSGLRNVHRETSSLSLRTAVFLPPAVDRPRPSWGAPPSPTTASWRLHQPPLLPARPGQAPQHEHSAVWGAGQSPTLSTSPAGTARAAQVVSQGRRTILHRLSLAPSVPSRAQHIPWSCASRAAGSEHGARTPPLTWAVGTRAPAPWAEALPGGLWQSPKSRRLKPQPRRLVPRGHYLPCRQRLLLLPRRLVSQGCSLPCRRPPSMPLWPLLLILLLTKALAPSGQGHPRTVSDLSRVPEAQRPWTVGLVPAAGLLCDAQWRQGATRVWGGFTPSRTTETGHRLSWETFPAVRQWVCGPQKDLGATRQEPPRAVPSHRCL